MFGKFTGKHMRRNAVFTKSSTPSWMLFFKVSENLQNNFFVTRKGLGKTFFLRIMTAALCQINADWVFLTNLLTIRFTFYFILANVTFSKSNYKQILIEDVKTKRWKFTNFNYIFSLLRDTAICYQIRCIWGWRYSRMDQVKFVEDNL